MLSKRSFGFRPSSCRQRPNSSRICLGGRKPRAPAAHEQRCLKRVSHIIAGVASLDPMPVYVGLELDLEMGASRPTPTRYRASTRRTDGLKVKTGAFRLGRANRCGTTSSVTYLPSGVTSIDREY